MKKPKIAFLGIMQELYDNMYPDITVRQEKYARSVVEQLKDVADLDFPSAARCREDIEKNMRYFKQGNYDGLMVAMLTYGPGLRTIKAFQDWDLPILVANIQPLPQITKEWDMSHLTFNQGIHGAQDTANTLVRLGKKFTVATGDWKSPEFKQKIKVFAAAAQGVSCMRRSHVAIFGQMPGMGDILVNPHTFTQKFGTQMDHCNIGLIAQGMEKASAKEIEAVMAENRRNFDIDPKLTQESEAYAARFQVAIEKFLKEYGYDSWTMYFNQPGFDGRFKQIHMMAASNLMAKGYAYAGEGDTTCAALMAAGYGIASNPNFTEMYAMDFPSDSILMSHMGEGNWKIARKDRKPRLIDRPLGIGGLENPPTVLFQGQPGPATLVTLAPVADDRFNLLVAYGDILDTEVLPNLEMPYFNFKPATGVNSCMENWLKYGGPHHQVIHLGDMRKEWALFAQFTGVNHEEI